MARQTVTGVLSGPGMSARLAVSHGNYDNPPGLVGALWGTFSGTVQLVRSRDGVTWNPVYQPVGTPVSFSAFPVDINISDPVVGDQYAWSCVAYTSGQLSYDLFQ